LSAFFTMPAARISGIILIPSTVDVPSTVDAHRRVPLHRRRRCVSRKGRNGAHAAV
jgi:hypothetical protein